MKQSDLQKTSPARILQQMDLVTPIPGKQETSPPEWQSLSAAMKKINLKNRVSKTDWRSELAEQDGSWIIYWDLNDDDEQVIRIGLIEHAKDEKNVRAGQLVSVRPLRRPRTKAPIAMILGTIEIKESERHIWASVDGMSPENVGSFLRHSPWWVILTEPETGAPHHLLQSRPLAGEPND